MLNANKWIKHAVSVLSYNISQLSAIYDKNRYYLQERYEYMEEIDKLKSQNKRLKKQIKELEKRFKGLKKNSNEQSLIAENNTLHKENNLLKLEIEKLYKELELIKESQEINETLTDNVVIEEESLPPTKSLMDKLLQQDDYSEVVIVGGKYNSEDKTKITSLFAKSGLFVTFVKAENTLRKIDTIKNADVVLFDTSYNAHAYYYKVKSVAKKLYHINGKNELLQEYEIEEKRGD